jgi:hypothetical protein
MKSARHPCQIVNELEISRQIFEKFSNIQFLEYPSSGSRQTDRYDESNSRSSQFCEAPKKPTSWNHYYTVLLQQFVVKGKAIPLQAWTDPEGSRRLRLPDFKTIGT